MAPAAPATSSHVSTPRRWRVPLADYSLLMQAYTDTLPALLAPEPPQHRIHQASYSVEDIPPYPAHPPASSSTQTAKPLPHHRASTRQHAPSRTPSPGRSRPFRHILCEFYTTQPSTLPLQLRPPHTGITYLTTPSCLQILNQNPHRDIHTLPPAGRRSNFRHPMPPRGHRVVLNASLS